jgi:hypothetical protein
VHGGIAEDGQVQKDSLLFRLPRQMRSKVMAKMSCFFLTYFYYLKTNRYRELNWLNPLVDILLTIKERKKSVNVDSPRIFH